MDSARRWLTQIVGRGEPDPVEEPTLPSTGDEQWTVRDFYLPDGRRAVALGSPVPTRTETVRPGGDPLVDLFPPRQRQYGYANEKIAKRFVEIATILQDVPAAPADPMPFHGYWSTYDDMDLAQRRWYFWWRQELKAGRPLPADLSYVFVHVFELINLVGVAGPEEAFDRLSILDATYSPMHTSLPYHLHGWIEDLAIVHGLGERLDQRWAAQLADPRNRHYSARLLDRQLRLGFLRMPLPVIGVLARYAVGGSFARAGNEHLLEAFARLTLDAVDSAFRVRTGNTLAERFAPPRYGATRGEAFQGAVYGGERIEVERVPDNRYADRLADRLHGVVKYTDLRLRDEVKFKHRLRSVKITKTDAKIVDRLIAEQLPAYLQRFGPAKTGGKIAAPAPVPEPVQVTVDLGRVRELIGESDATRTRLIEAMEGAGGEEAVRREPVKLPTPPVALTIADGFDETQSEALRALLDEASPEVALRRIAGAAGLLPEVLLDSINEAGYEIVGDALIDMSGPVPSIHSEYRDHVRAMVDS